MKTKLLIKAFHECTTGPSVICVNGKWMVGKWLIGYYNYNPLLDRHELFSYDDIQCYVHIIIPETICRFTGFYDGTTWDELPRGEMSKFLSTKNEDGTYNTKEDWSGYMIFENDIVLYLMEHHSFKCKAVVGIGKFSQSSTIDGEYGPIGSFGPFVRVDNFVCTDDWGPRYFPEYEREDSLANLTNPYMNEKYRCKVIGDIFTNPDFVFNVRDYTASNDANM